MDGILIVDKPSCWTSFDVCAKIRNLTHTKKVGHSGTLDPMATGVLPVFLGKATKSIQQYMNGKKKYIGEMTLGATSDTMDSTGILTPLIPLSIKWRGGNPDEVREGVRIAFKIFTGKIKQKPPMFSAKKIKGKPLYKFARKGIEVDRVEKEIEIYSLDLLEINDNKINFKVFCSKGTYIRVLVHDIGYELGCGAYLSALRRTFAEPFGIDQTHTMDEIIALNTEGNLDTIISKYE